eukprot:3757588-Amphidinium_carterae.2
MEEGKDENVQGIVGDNPMPRMPDHQFDRPVDNNDYWPHGFDRAAAACCTASSTHRQGNMSHLLPLHSLVSKGPKTT